MAPTIVLQMFLPSFLAKTASAVLVCVLFVLYWLWRKTMAGSEYFGWALAWAGSVTLAVIPKQAPYRPACAYTRVACACSSIRDHKERGPHSSCSGESDLRLLDLVVGWRSRRVGWRTSGSDCIAAIGGRCTRIHVARGAASNTSGGDSCHVSQRKGKKANGRTPSADLPALIGPTITSAKEWDAFVKTFWPRPPHSSQTNAGPAVRPRIWRAVRIRG